MKRLQFPTQCAGASAIGLYKQVTDASGLTPRRERMTVEGFRRAKVPENAEKGLTSGAESGKINIKVDEFVPCLKDAKTGEILPTKDLTGGTQKYIGVAGHLFAAAIEESVNAGTGGCVYGFAVNKEVLAHYIKEFGAVHIPIEHPFQFMIADEAAQRVVDIYNYERRR